MEKELNPVRNYQYTMWKHWKDHDEFHEEQFNRIFELCTSCLEMVVEGPACSLTKGGKQNGSQTTFYD